MTECGGHRCGPEGLSILEKIKRKLPHGASDKEAVARKFNCSSVWCEVCYRRFHLQRHFSRLSELPWESSRMVTLTLDRQKVGSGADAYVWLRESKALGRFFQNLGRAGIDIKDWAGQIEWHRDGTPHFHLVIQTAEGKAGMIGNEALKTAWPWGGVYEEYFKSEKHWKNTVGYFGKAGYFHKGKKFQTQLPDYFKSDFFKGKRIMRFYSARRSSVRAEESQPKKETEPVPSQTVTGQKLETCGQSTIVFYLKETYDDPNFERCKYLARLNIPYQDFCQQVYGEYVSGLGFNFSLKGNNELRFFNESFKTL